MAGLVDIDSGSVHIGGVDVTLVEPYHRNVAMAFESYALYPQKTVSENLASPLKSGRTGKYTDAQRTERIDQVTTTLGINHLLKRFPRELSNGQRQRVALGRVLVRPADIYLLDEPLSHLDAKLRAAMRAELKQLGAMSNTTTIYVTHDYQEALALGDRVAVCGRARWSRSARRRRSGGGPRTRSSPVPSGSRRSTSSTVWSTKAVSGSADGSLDVPIPAGAPCDRGDRVRVGLRPCDIHVTGRRARGLRRNGDARRAAWPQRRVDGDSRRRAGDRAGIRSRRRRRGRRLSMTVADTDVHVFTAGDGDTPAGDVTSSRTTRHGGSTMSVMTSRRASRASDRSARRRA